MSSTPSLWPSPWFLGPHEWPHIIKEPMHVPTLVGDEFPHLKGVIIAYIIHNMLSSLGAPSSIIQKNQEKEKGKLRRV